MLIWILIAIIFLWLFILTGFVLGVNLVVNNHDDILHILADDINNIRFGKND